MNDRKMSLGCAGELHLPVIILSKSLRDCQRYSYFIRAIRDIRGQIFVGRKKSRIGSTSAAQRRSLFFDELRMVRNVPGDAPQ